MIPITRLPELTILTKNKEKWLVAYLKRRETNPGLRPDSRQYGHQGIRDVLAAMSHGKCFYCERELGEVKGEVDHYVEIAEEPTLAFDWNNLYLSCPECNRRKLPNSTISVFDCLDPCNSSRLPADHLTFDSEQIRPRIGSQKGAKTIQKHRLDRGELNYLRVKWLQQFHRFLNELRKRQLRDGGRPLTRLEKEAIARFKEPYHAFSLMFSVYLSQLDL